MGLPALGKTICKLDANRLMLPLSLRETWGLSSNSRLIVTVGEHGSLVLYPAESWESHAPRELTALLEDDEHAERVREFQARVGSTPRLDRNGRIMLTEEQILFAGLSKEVVLVPSFTRAQLWSPERYAGRNPDPPSPQEYDQLLARMRAERGKGAPPGKES